MRTAPKGALLLAAGLLCPTLAQADHVPVFADDFDDDALDPTHWLVGHLKKAPPIAWGEAGSAKVRAEQGEARLTGGWEDNALLGLKNVDLSQGGLVSFRAKYSGCCEQAYQVVVSAAQRLEDASRYELALPLHGPGGLLQQYQTYAATLDAGTASLYRGCAAGPAGATWSLVAHGELPGARWVYWMEGNEDRTLHMDNVRVTADLEFPVLETPPGSPRDLEAELTALDRTITLQWKPPSDSGSCPVVGYRVYRGTSSGGLTQLLAVVGEVLTYTDAQLALLTTYYYRVSAFSVVSEGQVGNEASPFVVRETTVGSSESATVCPSPLLCPAPPALRATVTLARTAPSLDPDVRSLGPLTVEVGSLGAEVCPRLCPFPGEPHAGLKSGAEARLAAGGAEVDVAQPVDAFV